ncbi:hypothetical protein VP1G_06445 [Cytospora mali]|uniref:CENP-V/GFA domain-containing protein n=1 Tax=Cytospora mali TaxID=578113 RepID=A0A194V5L1_CYTMA|nr:hypothetical protein VP1G_06445 [Valsa mali var. pyri (nom. inval.)]
MSIPRPLRGSCACHRNQYLIRAPEGATEFAQVLFGTDPSHRIAQANPLSAHIRVPLTWYYSATFSFFPDENATTIRRLYENPFEGYSRRHFCGFCGTPLTYWSDHPRSEAEYIQVTMGSLCREDLGDLEDLGLIPGSPVSEGERLELPTRGGREPDQASTGQGNQATGTTSTDPQPVGRETLSIPWIDSIVEGSSLGGRLKGTKGTRQSADGTTRIEWEIVEFNAEGDDDEAGSSSSNNGKRKLGDRDDVDDHQMEGASKQ